MALVDPPPLVCGRLQWRGRGGVASLAASAWHSIDCYASCTFVCTSVSQLLSNVHVCLSCVCRTHLLRRVVSCLAETPSHMLCLHASMPRLWLSWLKVA